MENLSCKEREIIQRRYLGDGQTLQEVSKVFGVTRERIRQIESEAIRKLRKQLETSFF